MLEPWPERERESLVSLRILELLRVRRRSPRTGAELDFHVIDTHDWVNVVPFDREDRIVLVRQFRHGASRFTLEIPGGVVHEGEKAEVAALRELREESGYEAGEVRYLGTVNPNPAIFTNTCGSYLATGCVRVGDPEPDPGEDLEVVTMTRDELGEAVRAGEVDHALVLAAFAWLECFGSENPG